MNYIINLDISKTKFLISKHTSKVYKYHPNNRDELKELINKLIKERGNKADLNDIDTSAITDMYYLFYESDFNGDISKWNVSNVINMTGMFACSKFTGKNGDISNWDVSNVINMPGMFYKSNFNGNISNWDVSNTENMYSMFYQSIFNGDISSWNINKVKSMINMFKDSPLQNNPPKWYKH